MKFLQKLRGFPVQYSSSVWVTVAFAALLSASCTQIQKPVTEPLLTVTTPPPKQEFRWSNGKMPKSFDPARAAAAPETDIVRAIFEGLTEIDANTLEAVPSLAEKWSATNDNRIWTFELRKDARWSNGKRVTADDFVTSWKRLGTLGDKTAHPELFQNIVGLKTEKPPSLIPPVDPADLQHLPPKAGEIAPLTDTGNITGTLRFQEPHTLPTQQIESGKPHDRPALSKQTGIVTEKKFGVEATGSTTLKVTLELPDKDFAKLVANPIFRPIYGDGSGFESDPLDAAIVTNGGFTITGVAKDGIGLDRSKTYWNRAAVSLEHIRFVPKDTAESALEAYKKGELDVVTNADFEPLALKLLSPFDDFHQTTHGALNLYEFNTKNAPFNDRRVREALAVSIDRERLVDGELEGSTRPAGVFLPLGDKVTSMLSFDVEKARDLLDKAGYPNGLNFPHLRLVINRNETQQRVARTVARMWKQNLNLDTLVIVKESSEIEKVRAAGDFDLIRRGVVLPTNDEMVGLASIFGVVTKPLPILPKEGRQDQTPSEPHVEKTPDLNLLADEITNSPLIPSVESEPNLTFESQIIISEEDAMFELNAIPLYFPTSYSLVRPYVHGFEMNGLDAPSLNGVSIDSGWQPGRTVGE